MKDERPFIIIAGDIYRINLPENQLLLMLPVGTGKILDMNEMTYDATVDRYRLLYDKQHKTVFKITHDTWRLPDDIVMAEICGRCVLDPFTWREENNIKAPVTENFLATAQSARYSRLLPRVPLGGHDFFYDPQQRNFIDTLNPDNILKKEWFESPHHRDTMTYNTKTRSLAGLTPNENRRDLIQIRLPSPEEQLKLAMTGHQPYSLPPTIKTVLSMQRQAERDKWLGPEKTRRSRLN